MGYIFDYKDSVAYDTWYNSQYNRLAALHQNQLLNSLLKPASGDSILDIGCGTGETLKTFSVTPGLDLTGLDPSPYMLDFARKKIKDKAELHRGFAEDLPFDDNAFNHACLIITLEYAENPRKAVEEAARVAKDRLFIGVLNRYALINMQRRVKGIFEKSIYNNAQFFSIWELKHIVRTVLGRVPVSWRTVNLFPAVAAPIVNRIQETTIVQKIPFGTYAGMVVSLKPRYRVRPLALRLPAKGDQRLVQGQCTSIKENEKPAG